LRQMVEIVAPTLFENLHPLGTLACGQDLHSHQRPISSLDD
jgi:hypothetical protein